MSSETAVGALGVPPSPGASARPESARAPSAAERRRLLAGRAADAGWSVRALEAEIARGASPRSQTRGRGAEQEAAAARLHDAIVDATGCDVRARPHRNGYQVIMDQEAADRLAQVLCDRRGDSADELKR